jgi:hypothetical protein
MSKGSSKKKILYICTNDGSDMRINKEIKTLVKYADVYFLGVGEYGDKNYARIYCKDFFLIQDKRNSIRAIFKQIIKFLQLSRKYKFDSYHIINEQLMVFFYPFLFSKYVVLDIFDSFFMKMNRPKNKLKYIKRLVYSPINYSFVTDENRRTLMPDFIQNKLGVLENFPNQYKGITEKRTERLSVFYNGSMSYSRGTEILVKLTEKFKDIKVIMAGWLADEATVAFSQSPSVDYRGVITQIEATKIAAMESDYIMCCYEPSNQNNINASPNKIYDAIQAKTPVIMNSEIIVSEFVKTNKIGIVIDDFYGYSVDVIYKDLIENRNKFIFSDSQAIKYSWESVELKLLYAHKLI